MVLYPNKLPESERVCSGICKITTIWMNDTHFKTFFLELWNKLQKSLGLNNGFGFHR